MGRNGPKVDQNQSKITQNKPFLPQYRPDMVIIRSHMASIPMSLSHTTYTSHIQCHMVSDGPKIASNQWFLGDISPPQKYLKRKPYYSLFERNFETEQIFAMEGSRRVLVDSIKKTTKFIKAYLRSFKAKILQVSKFLSNNR